MAATVVGFDRHVDTATLNDLGELAAVMAGRTTYELHGELIVPRTRYRLAAPRDPSIPVVADHVCQPIPDVYLDRTHERTAMALVASILGGQLVSDPNETPPF